MDLGDARTGKAGRSRKGEQHPLGFASGTEGLLNGRGALMDDRFGLDRNLGPFRRLFHTSLSAARHATRSRAPRG